MLFTGFRGARILENYFPKVSEIARGGKLFAYIYTCMYFFLITLLNIQHIFKISYILYLKIFCVFNKVIRKIF